MSEKRLIMSELNHQKSGLRERLHKKKGSAKLVLPSFCTIRKRVYWFLVTKSDVRCARGKESDIPGFARSKTVKKLPSRKFRREEKCERKPSGFPFASNNPPQRQNCKIMLQNFICNSESSLSKESKGAVASSQRPAGSQAAHSEFEIPSHTVPAASPPGLFPFAVLHIIENYGIFSVKY